MSVSSFKRAHDLQARAAAAGFDWPQIGGMLEKIDEELAELRQALHARDTDTAVSEELGDILFVLVNLARRLALEPESVLHTACDKFERRFTHVRAELAKRGLHPEQAGLDVMEALWNEAKRLEREQP